MSDKESIYFVDESADILVAYNSHRSPSWAQMSIVEINADIASFVRSEHKKLQSLNSQPAPIQKLKSVSEGVANFLWNQDWYWDGNAQIPFEDRVFRKSSIAMQEKLRQVGVTAS